MWIGVACGCASLWKNGVKASGCSNPILEEASRYPATFSKAALFAAWLTLGVGLVFWFVRRICG